MIAHIPKAYRNVPWIEVEAKGKEEAIAALRALRTSNLANPA
jgi:UV DNA damage endonuclease